MSKCIKNENGIYVELHRDKIKFESKEAELIFDLSLENDELQQENQELKKQIDGIIEERDYLFNKLSTENKNLTVENKKLKKQLEEANEKILLLQVSEPMLKYKKALEENQQKEFIDYLEKERCLTFYSSTPCMYAYDVFKEILSKYKEIIGGKE